MGGAIAGEDLGPRLRFGGFSFDGGRRLLHRGGTALHLSPKAFQLLTLLLERRPGAVAREEIFEALWPAEGAAAGRLTSLVSELRHVLGSGPRGRAFIRTVHRYGYAFDGDAHEMPVAPRHVLVRGLQHVELSQGGNLLGRERSATVRLGHPSVAHEHARIVVTDDRAELEDLAAIGSTFRGTEAIRGRVVLEDGDGTCVADIRLTYRILAAVPGG
ncbi:MAG TPA: winged helix-turn-helix domain-containing protein [Thermoanaerobaculia bacterium]|nr:winged helix-turn-helix domain-containing protein [Thermoanaerobaculia bacterium]